METDNSSIVKVRIIVGTYSKADEGIIDCINIMQRIKDKLMAQGTLDKRYRIEYPYKWVVPDEQPYPYWQIEGELSIVVPQVVGIIDKSDEYFS